MFCVLATNSILSLGCSQITDNKTSKTKFFDPKINGFPGHMVKHFYVKFGDHSCIGF